VSEKQGADSMTALRKCFYAVLLASTGAGFIFAAKGADELQLQSVASPPPRMTVFHRAESVLGKTLTGASGESAGRIVDVLADPTGRVCAAVVDFGGFMGVGSRRIAVDWHDLRFEGSKITVDLTPEKLSRAPQVREGRPIFAISARNSRDRVDASDQMISPP
jgi:hypothetical protein